MRARLSRVRPRLTFANVTSLLALFIALGGAGAYAANTVFSSDIVDGEVKNPDLATAAVTSGKINDGSVSNADLATAAVTSGKINDGSVANGDLGANAVTTSKI